ncbi:hypothetical protein RJT34_10725 [Clitoria ternatea]|uniref:Rx N-terminal domain-containing protein n=1 Tax=Clitoria ternatea TaxID=43366 RepID=A0AAN9JKQ2_CLITE
MAETAVGIVTDKLISLLRDEVSLLKGVHSKVEWVKDELFLIQAFLKDADAKAENSSEPNHAVKAWVKQLRDVAYRTEDVVDLYLLKVAERRNHGHHRLGFVVNICFCIKTIIPRHEISSEIDEITGAIKRLTEAKETLELSPNALPESGPNEPHGLRMGAHFIDEEELVGVDKTREELTDQLLNGESKRRVIAVVGEGGLEHEVESYRSNYGQIRSCFVCGIEELKKPVVEMLVDTIDQDDIIEELKNLKRMRVLAVRINKTSGSQICNAIKKMPHLSSLSISAVDNEERGGLELQSLVDPPLYLQRLYLIGHLKSLPEWILKLKHLGSLTLSWSRLAEDPLLALKNLPALIHLCLFESYEGVELCFLEGWFPKLKLLRLQSLPSLRTLKFDEKALPYLEDLELGPCPQMVKVPANIQNLESLKYLTLIGMRPHVVEDIKTRLKENIWLYVRDNFPM